MEGGDEAYEAEGHDEHHGGREAEAGRLVGVESQHVARSHLPKFWYFFENL